jgi:hypothetical protein
MISSSSHYLRQDIIDKRGKQHSDKTVSNRACKLLGILGRPDVGSSCLPVGVWTHAYNLNHNQGARAYLNVLQAETKKVNSSKTGPRRNVKHPCPGKSCVCEMPKCAPRSKCGFLDLV